LHHAVWKKFTDISEVLVASIIRAMRLIALMMEAESTSETSVNFYQASSLSHVQNLFLFPYAWV
jgi:hypothetical protein